MRGVGCDAGQEVVSGGVGGGGRFVRGDGGVGKGGSGGIEDGAFDAEAVGAMLLRERE